MPFFNPRTHIMVSSTLVEGTDAFTAAIKKEVSDYMLELGRPCPEKELIQAIGSIQNYRFSFSGLQFTYYRQ